MTPLPFQDPSDPLTPLAKQLRLSATLEINEQVKRRREHGKPVVHLGFGEASFPVQKDVLKAHREAAESTSYLPVAGLPKLKEAIARFQTRRLGVTIDPDQVVIAPGSKPLLFALFDILQGDALIPRPSWVSYEPQVMHAGKRLFWVETDAQDRHTMTESSLESTYKQAVVDGGNPRIMLINSPSNPTGRIFSELTIQMIASFCQKHNMCLISDEIYSEIAFGSDPAVSTCAGSRFSAGPMVMTGGVSKTHSVGGWRIGFAIFPTTPFGTKVQQAIIAYASECWSAASAPAQEAACIAFDTSPELDLYRNQVSLLHETCTVRLYHALKDCGLWVAEPQGAFYVYPSFQPFARQLKVLGIHTSLELSKWLIQECGVAALPGEAFGEKDDGPEGGRLRLRMASSCLYFTDQGERYEKGYGLLEKEGKNVELPLLEEVVEVFRKAVDKLKAISLA